MSYVVKYSINMGSVAIDEGWIYPRHDCGSVEEVSANERVPVNEYIKGIGGSMTSDPGNEEAQTTRR